MADTRTAWFVLALGAVGCGGTPEASTVPEVDPTFETPLNYVGYYQIRAATDQTAPFDPPAFAIDDDPSAGLIGRACASPDASPCDDGPVLCTGATVVGDGVQVDAATNVPTACPDHPGMGSCVASYRRILLGHPTGRDSVQVETCSGASAAPACTTPLPASCPAVDASTVAPSCTTVTVVVGQFTI